MKKAIFILLASVTLSLSGQALLHEKYIGKPFENKTYYENILDQHFTVIPSPDNDTICSISLVLSDSLGKSQYGGSKYFIEDFVQHINQTHIIEMKWTDDPNDSLNIGLGYYHWTDDGIIYYLIVDDTLIDDGETFFLFRLNITDLKYNETLNLLTMSCYFFDIDI